MHSYLAKLTQTGYDEQIEVMTSTNPVSVKDVIIIKNKRYMVFGVEHVDNGKSYLIADAMDVK